MAIVVIAVERPALKQVIVVGRLRDHAGDLESSRWSSATRHFQMSAACASAMALKLKSPGVYLPR